MEESTLEKEISGLSREVQRLNTHWAWRSNGSAMRIVWYSFLRGVAFGLGSVVGATILVSVLVYFLSSVDFIPVVGEWAAEIVRIVQGAE